MSIKFLARTLDNKIVDSPLTPFLFPDGAAHVKGTEDKTEYDALIAYVTGMSNDDLMTLAMASNAASQRNEWFIVVLPYLPGARMDRGIPNGAYIYSKFINDVVRPDQIITIDPHSDKAADWYPRTKMVRDYDAPSGSGIRVKTQNYFKVFPVNRVIRREVQNGQTDNHADTYVGVIAPDKGARDRAAAAARDMGVKVYTGGKTRDFETGKLTGFHMEDELPAEGKLLIVDDICDGGGTFIGLAEATGLPKERLDLWVTHGIFSKGLSELRKSFGTIHTTDSFYFENANGDIGNTGYNADPDLVRVHKLAPYLLGEIDV